MSEDQPIQWHYEQKGESYIKVDTLHKIRKLESELTAVTEQLNEYKLVLQSAERHNQEIATKLEIVTEQLREEALKDLEFRRDLYSLQKKQINDIREQRDRLAEALESVKCELGVPQPEYPSPVSNAYWIADEALQSLKQPTP